MPPHQVEPITVPGLDRRVHVFRYGRLVDSFAVVTERFIVIVDTMVNPAAAEQIWRLLDGDRISESRIPIVVNTHSDWDHAWGNGFFAGPTAAVPAPVFGHQATRGGLDLEQAQAKLAETSALEPGMYESVEIALPSIEFEHTLSIHGGDLTLRLMPTPGHTPDHIAVWVPEIGLLIAGDGAEMPVPYVSDRSEITLLRRSLSQMAALDPSIVLYSHGGGFFSADLIDHNLAYFVEAEQRCRAFIDGAGDVVTLSPTALAWPLDQVMPPGGHLEPDEVAFYESSHSRAVEAMGRWLATGDG